MRLVRLLAVLLVGVAFGAGGVWIRYLHYPVVVVEGARHKIKCPAYTADDWEAFPDGMIATPEAASVVSEQVRDALGGAGGLASLLRRRVVVRDLGDDWLVRDESIHPMPGGGTTFRISKCDGRTTFVAITQ